MTETTLGEVTGKSQSAGVCVFVYLFEAIQSQERIILIMKSHITEMQKQIFQEILRLDWLQRQVVALIRALKNSGKYEASSSCHKECSKRSYCLNACWRGQLPRKWSVER